jgi:hypothetical protein
VAVEGIDAATLQGAREAGVQPLRERGRDRLARGQDLVRRDSSSHARLIEEPLESLERAQWLMESHRDDLVRKRPSVLFDEAV